MTVTLVRPARAGIARFTTAAPVRVRPAPAMDPPYDDEPGGRPNRPEPSGRPMPGPVTPTPSGQHRPDEAYRAVRRYLDLSLEVLGGFGPIGHLRGLTDPGRFEEVAGQLTRLGAAPITRPGSGLVRVVGDRVRLRHLRICEVRDGAVEAAAVLARGDAVRAMTLRLERHSGGWLCTHLQVL
ncbi:MAG: hypothetical protein AUI14_02540 [Actinobacteria bacterium 13_2_20CM_2_71_6]|nr:MAG: hypothetical protein AUI14_02540 [Actinobacteria bacterium 13_2_20CM_2_71_6]